MSLYKQITELTHGYAAKGGKRSRNDRRKIMLQFAKFASRKGVNSLGQLGKRQVILYWKANDHLKEATIRNHWYALNDLWELAELAGEPPKFKAPDELNTIVTDVNKPLDTEGFIDEILDDGVLTELR